MLKGRRILKLRWLREKSWQQDPSTSTSTDSQTKAHIQLFMSLALRQPCWIQNGVQANATALYSRVPGFDSRRTSRFQHHLSFNKAFQQPPLVNLICLEHASVVDGKKFLTLKMQGLCQAKQRDVTLLRIVYLFQQVQCTLHSLVLKLSTLFSKINLTGVLFFLIFRD